MTSGTCDSCGDEDDHLVTVHREYLTPKSWDHEASVAVVDDQERWCLVCRTHYPHRLA